jgi:N-acetylmuramoyl-L-alanine amidase
MGLSRLPARTGRVRHHALPGHPRAPRHPAAQRGRAQRHRARAQAGPGRAFPWATLAEAGIGLWPGPAPEEARALPPLGIGEAGPGVRSLRATLRRIGYRVTAEGDYDRGLAVAITAFHRHWAPHRTDGVADGETRWRAGRVLGLAEGRVRPAPDGAA